LRHWFIPDWKNDMRRRQSAGPAYMAFYLQKKSGIPEKFGAAPLGHPEFARM
jgi:hypothetical protein